MSILHIYTFLPPLPSPPLPSPPLPSPPLPSLPSPPLPSPPLPSPPLPSPPLPSPPLPSPPLPSPSLPFPPLPSTPLHSSSFPRTLPLLKLFLDSIYINIVFDVSIVSINSGILKNRIRSTKYRYQAENPPKTQHLPKYTSDTSKYRCIFRSIDEV